MYHVGAFILMPCPQLGSVSIAQPFIVDYFAVNCCIFIPILIDTFFWFCFKNSMEILAPPRLRLEPQRQVVRPGDQVEIRCEASGDQPITINWYKMDGVLPPAVLVNNGQLQVRNDPRLFFSCLFHLFFSCF